MKCTICRSCLVLLYTEILLFLMVMPVYAASGVAQIVFEERAIEGKIRKPQLVLIKAEQRPTFGQIVMKSVDREMNLDEYSEGNTVEKTPYEEPFQIRNYHIINVKP